MKDKLIEFIKSHKVILISIFVTFFIEIFICNYGFFRTFGKFKWSNNKKYRY